MIKVYILDDQDINIMVLQSLLAKFFPDIELCGDSTDPRDAVVQIIDKKPDLLFLDVSMPGLDGFEFLQQIGDHSSLEVIFVTAYGEFALQAFEHQASGYITKPIETTRLILAVNKVIDHIRQRKALALLEDGKQDRAEKEEKKLALPTQNGLFFIAPEQVYYCESSGNYTTFYMSGPLKQLMVSRQLGQFEMSLRQQHFIRIHDKYMINLKYVKAYRRGNGGILVLENGIELPVSARRKKELMKHLI